MNARLKNLGKTALVLGFLLTPPLFAGAASLSQSTTPTGSYSTGGFSVCSSGTRSFKVSYDHWFNPGGTFGSNPYRMTVWLFKNGGQIGSSSFTGSSAWTNQYFYNLSVSPGTFTATVKLEKHTFTGWTTVETVTSNGIAAGTSATPDFNVNGAAVPTDGSPIAVCASMILINAAATTCETTYWVGIHETDRWWNRTYQYEWGTWFAGQAPNNISLQQLSTNSANYWIYGPPNRKGNTLIGGYLDPPNNSTERYYTVEVCTAEPSWQCKVGLIKVNGSC